MLWRLAKPIKSDSAAIRRRMAAKWVTSKTQAELAILGVGVPDGLSILCFLTPCFLFELQ
jgi:hypothetical protein